jgi:hypothetical protein
MTITSNSYTNLLVTEQYIMTKKRVNTTFKTSLLNDCTNHLSFQLGKNNSKNESQKKHIDTTYEAPIADIVTSEFIRGYN